MNSYIYCYLSYFERRPRSKNSFNQYFPWIILLNHINQVHHQAKYQNSTRPCVSPIFDRRAPNRATRVVFWMGVRAWPSNLTGRRLFWWSSPFAHLTHTSRKDLRTYTLRAGCSFPFICAPKVESHTHARLVRKQCARNCGRIMRVWFRAFCAHADNWLKYYCLWEYWTQSVHRPRSELPEGDNLPLL